jgi:ornithine cyclodeaminase/alanine dehydrogenase-like protein (mu-crystallin family)
MALYLSEDDVGRLLTPEACIDAVEEAFHQWAEGRASNRPRARAVMAGGLLHVLAAASEGWGRMAAKVYATTRQGARFVVLLFDGKTSELLAIIEADRLGQTRTGAATAVATRHLARPDARTLALIGTGWQARGQARAIASVRRLASIRAYGRDRERLLSFCHEVEEACGVPASAAPSAEAAARDADIIVTATSSARPVLEGSWLRSGVHVNAVGSNRADRRELDDDAVRRADLIVVDSLEQARLEAGDLLAGSDATILDRAVELSKIVARRHVGRRTAEDITLFKSLGIGLEDLAAASLLYDQATRAGAGTSIPPPPPPSR